MPSRVTSFFVAGCVVALFGLAACGSSGAGHSVWRVGICVGVTGTTPAGHQAEVEVRQGDKVVSSASLTVPGATVLTVPAGTGEVKLFVDGHLFASGEGEFTAQKGTGCPTP